MSLQALREARAAKAREVKNLLDASVTNWTKDIEAKVDAIYVDIDNLDAQVARYEKATSLVDSLETRAVAAAERNGLSVDENHAKLSAERGAFNAMLRYGVENLTADERALIRTAQAEGGRPGVRNVAEGSSATGGVLVPTTVMPTAIAKLKAFGGVRLVSSQISTSAGNQLTWGTYDDTASTGELVAEGVTASDSDLTFGSVSIGAWKFSSMTIPVSIEILQDAAVNVEQIVMDALLMRIARGQNKYFTNGTGTSQPKGIVTAAATGFTQPTGFTTTFAYDSFVELIHSVDPAYRQMPSTGFMFNDTVLKTVKKLKDSAGRPLWLAGTAPALVAPRDPDTFMGYAYTINQDMASPAANAKTMLFGAMQKYLVRDVMEMQLFRFTDSAYVKKGQVGFLAWARADGNLVDASNASIAALVMSAT